MIPRKNPFRGQGGLMSPEFKALLDQSMEELRLKTSAHVAIARLGQAEKWNLDQDQGDLVFTLPDMIVTCPAQIIGSYDSRGRTWMWAWANPSIADNLKRDALKVKAYGLEHRVGRLTTAEWVGDETEAWKMTALAVMLCAAQGAYRGPAGTTFVFMTFGPVRLSKRT